MLANIINRAFSSPLTLRLANNIVIRYQPKRSTFDKTNYNQEWIPRQKPYSKHRKPRQEEWTSQEFVFPKLIPPLYKPCTFKHFVKNVIEKEQLQKAKRSKQYLVGDIRSGDIIDITVQQTFQSEQKVTHRCLVLAFKRKNSLSAALEVAMRFGGMPLKAIYLIHAPSVKNIQLISRGSGCFASNLKNNWEKFNKLELTTAKIKKGVMKNRQDMYKKREEKKSKGSVKFDQINSDSFKRLV